MHVLDIIILSMKTSQDGKSVVGDVQFTLLDAAGQTLHMTMNCNTAYSRRILPDAILIGDAIRQLRRMPEIRSGADRISFAKGLKPLERARAA